MKRPRELFWHYWLPVLGMLTLIKMESTDSMSGQKTFGLLQHMFLWAGIHVSDSQMGMLNLVMRKSGHMVGYGLLCLFWMLLFRGSYWLQHEYKSSLRGSIQVRRVLWRSDWAWLAVLLTFVVASADELHQMSIPSRSGSWWDVSIDTGAGVVALMLVRSRAGRVSRERRA